MKRSLLGLLIAVLTFLSGILTAQIFRSQPKLVPKPLFEKKIVDIPLFEIAPISETKHADLAKKYERQVFCYEFRVENKMMPEVSTIRVARDFETIFVNGVFIEKDNLVSTAQIITHNRSSIRLIDVAWIELNDSNVKFKTRKFDEIEYYGIEYYWEGSIIKNKASEQVILRGTLQKFLYGEKIVEISGDFPREQPHSNNQY